MASIAGETAPSGGITTLRKGGLGEGLSILFKKRLDSRNHRKNIKKTLGIELEGKAASSGFLQGGGARKPSGRGRSGGKAFNMGEIHTHGKRDYELKRQRCPRKLGAKKEKPLT